MNAMPFTVPGEKLPGLTYCPPNPALLQENADNLWPEKLPSAIAAPDGENFTSKHLKRSVVVVSANLEPKPDPLQGYTERHGLLL